jgi:predicted kinase
MLIAMAGLPGTGKSTLAARLAAELGGVVLSKDVVRAALFPASVLDYSPVQDDAAMNAIFSAAKIILAADRARVLILDGRTFRKASQIADLYRAAAELGEEPTIIECVCDDATARERLERDAASGTHPAGNRNAGLHALVKATAEPLTVPRLTLDTGNLTLEECITRALEHLRRNQ